VRDSMYDDTGARLTLPPAVRANGVVNGTPVDTVAGGGPFRVGMLVVSAGAVTDGSNAITVQDSDDGSTNWQPYAGQTQGSIPALGTPQGNATYRMALDTLPRRWLRAVINTTGATTGGTIGAVFLLRSGPGSGQVT